MEIRVTDPAEEDFNLNVVFGWIASLDCGARKWRGRTGSRV